MPNRHYLPLLALLSSWLLAACTSKDNKPPLVRRSPIISSTISNHKINAFAEDKFGHIWIGTFFGLNKFDGKEHCQYFATDDSLSLPDNNITYLFCDSKERLWVLTQDGVCRYTNQNNFHRVPMETNYYYATYIVEDSHGRIFLKTHKELLEYEEGKDRFVTRIQLNGVSHQATGKSVFLDDHDDLWIFNEGEFLQYETKGFSVVWTFLYNCSGSTLLHTAILNSDGRL